MLSVDEQLLVDKFLNKREEWAEAAIAGYTDELLRAHPDMIMPTINYWKTVISSIKWLRSTLSMPVGHIEPKQETSGK